MAETVLFSSYRRPEPLRPALVTETAAELPVEATPSLEPAAVGQASVAERPSMEPELPQESAAAWTDMTSIRVSSDQLGLIHPSVIQLVASLPNSSAVVLEADTAGLYRPPSFRPEPWGSSAYDQSQSLLTGLAADPRVEFGHTTVTLAQGLASSSSYGASTRG